MKTSGDFIIQAKNKILGKKEDISQPYPFEEFFPSPDYDDPESVKKRFYIKTSYRDHLYQIYLKDEGFRVALNKFFKNKYTVTSRIQKVMKDAINQKEAVIFEINGHIGSGKSALIKNNIIPVYGILMKRNFIVHCDISDLTNNYTVILDKSFTDEPFHVYVTYSNSESNDIIANHFKKGDVIFQDEMPEQHGKGSKISVGNIENILRIAARKKGINIIFISPDFIEVKQVDYYITILAINKIHRVTLAMISTNSKEHIGVGIFKLNIDPALDEYYERVSAKRKTEIQDAQGYSNVQLTDERKEKLVQELMTKVIEQAKKEKVTKIQKSYIESVMVTTNIAKEIFKNEIVSSCFARVRNMFVQTKDDAIEVTKKKKENEKDAIIEALKEKEEELDGDEMKEEGQFVIDIKNIIEIGVQKNKESPTTGLDPTHAQIFLDAIDPNNKVEDLAIKYKCRTANITVVKRRVGEWIAKIAGRRYEEYIEDYYKNLPDVSNVIRKTAPGNPDLVVYYKDNLHVDVFSLKCYSVDPETRNSVSIPKDKILQEIVEAKRLKKESPHLEVKCTIIFYNALSKKTTRIPVDYDNPLDTYSIPT